MIGAGEPQRLLIDDLMSRGTPHVVTRFIEGSALVGPFVVPGQTACLRCIDAAQTDRDTSWPLLVEQYARFSARDRGDGSAETIDPVLAQLACAWAVRDATSFICRRRPSTWSATIRIDAWLRDLATTSWSQHPACGCGWTMEQ
ncbi:MAG: hypothetical protein HZY75_06155 [Nocardioidaceae bacterium]|nr:MAG: hypothetical protein HZY75_06155 [Nocardioidaceae bacterium]